MNGVATRNKLSAAVGTDTANTPGHRFFDDDVTPRPWPHGLGTPGEAERAAQRRREIAFRRWFRVGVALAAMLSVIYAYARLAAPPHAPIHTGLHYHQRAAALPIGRAVYELDPHEGCLVYMHRDATADRLLVATVVSTHC